MYEGHKVNNPPIYDGTELKMGDFNIFFAKNYIIEITEF